ncbi:MAG TPA: SGNH/GDSL hydrolase family protein [Polyangiaceae bacterium]
MSEYDSGLAIDDAGTKLPDASWPDDASAPAHPDAGDDAGQDAGPDPIPDRIVLKGGRGWDNSNRLGSAPLKGLRGSVAGVTVALLVRIIDPTVNAILFDYTDGTGKGYRWVSDPSGMLTFSPSTLAANWKNSPGYNPSAELGKVQLLVGVHSGADGQIDLWAGDTRVGGGAFVDGYAPPALNGTRNTVGLRGNGSQAYTGADIFAWAGWDRPLTDAEIHSLYAYTLERGKLPANIPGLEGLYDVAADATGDAFPATVHDQVGDSDFAFYAGGPDGLDLVTVEDPEFAWGTPFEPRRVWLGIGDSEMGGRGDIKDAPAEYQLPHDGMWMVRSVGAGIEPYGEPCGDGYAASAGVSPIGLFGWMDWRRTGVSTVVVNAGAGGSKTEQWVPGQMQYERAVANVRHALSRTNTTLAGTVVFIGANDAALYETPPWLANTRITLERLGKAIGAQWAGKPVVIVQLPATVPTGAPYPGWASTRAQIQQLAAEDGYPLIQAPEGPWRESYGLHLATQGNVVVAEGVGGVVWN